MAEVIETKLRLLTMILFHALLPSAPQCIFVLIGITSHNFDDIIKGDETAVILIQPVKRDFQIGIVYLTFAETSRNKLVPMHSGF